MPESEAAPGAERRDRPAQSGRLSDAELIADLRNIIEGVEKRPTRSRRDKPVVGPAPTGPRPPLDDACARLIELVRKRCPGLLPAAPLGAGTALDPLPIRPTEVSGLVSIAARQAVLAAAGGRPASSENQLPATALWQDGPAALLVEVGAIAVQLGDGLVSVAIPVRCDQLPRGREVVTVDLVLGTAERPTGMLAATTEPRGSRLIVERWGEALTALAWQALLDTAGGVAGAAGVDEDGAVLVPTALAASANGLALVAQARHQIDRVRPGQVVLAPER